MCIYVQKAKGKKKEHKNGIIQLIVYMNKWIRREKGKKIKIKRSKLLFLDWNESKLKEENYNEKLAHKKKNKKNN